MFQKMLFVLAFLRFSYTVDDDQIKRLVSLSIFTIFRLISFRNIFA